MRRPGKRIERTNMGMTKFLIKAPIVIGLVIVTACAAASACAVFFYVTPRMEAFVVAITKMYDEILPEISVRNGRASIEKPQPYFVHGFLHEKVTLIIDTREGKQGEALSYLKFLEDGAVITRDALVIKLRGQVRIVPLKGIPDVVFNSQALRETAIRLLPRIVPWIAALILAYFMIAKILQVLVLAAVACAVTRFLSVSIRYGQWFRICSFAIVPPVCLDLFQYLTTVNVPGGLLAYFALYGALVILAGRDLYVSQKAC